MVFQVVFVENFQRHILLTAFWGKGQQMGQVSGRLKGQEETGKEGTWGNKGFEKLTHTPGNLESHVYSQDGRMLRKDLKRP